MKIKNVLLEKTTVELDSGKNCAILYPALLVITGFSWELKAVQVPEDNDDILPRSPITCTVLYSNSYYYFCIKKLQMPNSVHCTLGHALDLS